MPLAVLVTVVVSLMTKDCGEIEEFMAKAHGK
jgi:cation/acetate symporter